MGLRVKGPVGLFASLLSLMDACSAVPGGSYSGYSSLPLPILHLLLPDHLTQLSPACSLPLSVESLLKCLLLWGSMDL